MTPARLDCIVSMRSKSDIRLLTRAMDQSVVSANLGLQRRSVEQSNGCIGSYALRDEFDELKIKYKLHQRAMRRLDRMNNELEGANSSVEC